MTVAIRTPRELGPPFYSDVGRMNLFNTVEKVACVQGISDKCLRLIRLTVNQSAPAASGTKAAVA